MRQLLMLGFYCEVYRREPCCRVYINDVLVDEFNIPHTLHKDVWTPNMRLDPTFRSKEQINLQAYPPFFKCLELDDGGGRSLDIRVEIKNDDNNYANGFMTRHTRIKLCQCWLAPIKLWEQFNIIQNRWKYSLRNWYRYNGHNSPIANFYKGWRSPVFGNLIHYAEMFFPGYEQKLMPKELLHLYFMTDQHLPRIWLDDPAQYWVGTTGYFHLTLAKKLGFWRHITDRSRGYWKFMEGKELKDIYDKYKRDEDTRNINQ